MAGAAALLALDGSGRIARAAVALTGVDTGSVRLAEAEAMLAGAAPDDALFRRAAETASSVAGIEDVHASADYRRRIAVVLTRRALEAAHRRAAGTGLDVDQHRQGARGRSRARGDRRGAGVGKGG